MAAPTLATYAATAFTAGTPKSVTVAVQAGDLLVVLGTSEDGNYTITTPTASGVTFTLQRSLVIAQYTTGYIWTAPITVTNAALQVSASAPSGRGWGLGVYVFRDHGGVGAVPAAVNASGAPSLTITTTGANSAVVVLNSDWNAADGAGRVWRTGAGAFTEKNYYRDASLYTVYGGLHADAGAAGAKTVGLSAPSGQKYTTLAIEVLAGAGGGTPANVAAVPAAVSVLALAPTVSAGGAATVQAVPATVAVAAPVPVVLAETAVAGGGPAPVSVVALAPTVSGAASATVQAVTAAVLGDVLEPAVAAGVTVAAVTAGASVAAPVPAVSADGTVLAVPAVVETSALPPIVSVGGAGIVQAVTATVTTSALPPAIHADVRVASAVAVVTAGAQPPGVATGGSVLVSPASIAVYVAVAAPVVGVSSGGGDMAGELAARTKSGVLVERRTTGDVGSRRWGGALV